MGKETFPQAVCKKEGLHVARTINLNKESAVSPLEETISNINNLAGCAMLCSIQPLPHHFFLAKQLLTATRQKALNKETQTIIKTFGKLSHSKDDHEKPYNLSKPTLVDNSSFSRL